MKRRGLLLLLFYLCVFLIQQQQIIVPNTCVVRSDDQSAANLTVVVLVRGSAKVPHQPTPKLQERTFSYVHMKLRRVASAIVSVFLLLSERKLRRPCYSLQIHYILTIWKSNNNLSSNIYSKRGMLSPLS
jgi:hypothetical protein